MFLSVLEFWKKLHRKYFSKITRKFPGHFSAERIHCAKGHCKTANTGQKRWDHAPSKGARAPPSWGPQEELGAHLFPRLTHSSQNPTRYHSKKILSLLCCPFFDLQVWAIIFKSLWRDCSLVCDSSTHPRDRKSTRLNSSHITRSRMPSSA